MQCIRRLWTVTLCAGVVLGLWFIHASSNFEKDVVRVSDHKLELSLGEQMGRLPVQRAQSDKNQTVESAGNQDETNQSDVHVATPYKAALASVAKDNLVMVAIVDAGFLDMVINFFVSSIKPFNISNFIILATDNATCPIMKQYGIPCAMYQNFQFSQEASKYGSKEFNAKMSVRSQIMIDLLQEGYTVLHVDTDLFFYSNPLDDIQCPKEEYHMAALYDYVQYNAGFILLHPNNYSVELYTAMIALQQHMPKLTEQARLNTILKRFQAQDTQFHIQKLPEAKYQCGKLYFGNRFYLDTAPPCPECVVVHNNWIIGMNEKILRAKEMRQWMFDKDGYYSSTKAKYLTYENPAPGLVNEVSEQLIRLGRALSIGYLLDRIVILPKFYKARKQRPPLYFASISELDKAFGGAYREHSFLSHPLVPALIKESVLAPPLTIDSTTPTEVDDVQVLRECRNVTAAVLSLGPLEHDIIFHNDEVAAEMKAKLTQGLKKK